VFGACPREGWRRLISGGRGRPSRAASGGSDPRGEEDEEDSSSGRGQREAAGCRARLGCAPGRVPPLCRAAVPPRGPGLGGQRGSQGSAFCQEGAGGEAAASAEGLGRVGACAAAEMSLAW